MDEVPRNYKGQVRKVGAKLFDRDFAELEAENVDPRDADRALMAFIVRVEKGMPIHPTLLKFIAKGLKEHRLKDNVGGWVRRPAGRPAETEFDYYGMLAWYRAELDPEYCDKAILWNDDPNGKFEVIAKAMKADGAAYMSSASTVKRAVKWFAAEGLDDLSRKNLEPTHNLVVTEQFCRHYLHLEDRAIIKEHCANLIAHWRKNKVSNSSK